MVPLDISQASFISLGLSGTLLLAYRFLLREEITLGTFIMFNGYNMQIYNPLAFLGYLWRQVRQNMVDVEQVLNLLEQDQRIKEPEDPKDFKVKGGVIEFKDCTFTYDQMLPLDQQVDIIQKLSFKVEAGQSVGIVGQTGSGKSTIMRLLYRFYDLKSGQILIDGQDISEVKVSDLRR